MMRNIFLTICLLALIEGSAGTSIISAQTQDVESENVTRNVVRLMMDASEVMDTMKHEGGLGFKLGLKTYLEANLRRRLSEPEDRKLQDLASNLMENLFDRQVIEEAEIRIYQKYFSESEMTELYGFYNTALGRKLLKHQPVLMAEKQAIARDLLASQKQTFYKRFLVAFVSEFPDLTVELGTKLSKLPPESQESFVPGTSRPFGPDGARCSLENMRLLGGCQNLSSH